MTSTESVSLQITVYISPENVPKFWKALEPVYKKVIAEPECTFFELYQSPDDPGTISWVENWSKPKEWLLEHQVKKEYYKDYFAVTNPMFVKPQEIKILRRVGSPYTMVKHANGGLYD